MQTITGDTLDVGTAFGTVAIRRNLDENKSLTVGVDFSKVSVHNARNFAETLHCSKSLHFSVGDATHLPFKNAIFNTVVSADFTEHITRKQKMQFYRESYRVLKPGGKLIIYTPNRGGYILSTLRLKIIAILKGEGWKKYTVSFNKNAYELMQYDHKKYVKEYNNIYNATHFGVSFARAEKNALNYIGFKFHKWRYFAFEFKFLRWIWELFTRLPIVRELLSNNYLLIVKKPKK